MVSLKGRNVSIDKQEWQAEKSDLVVDRTNFNSHPAIFMMAPR